MYVNKCSKCGTEFETKNPKRVICPSCLYPDKKPILSTPSPSVENEFEQKPNPQQSEDYRSDRLDYNGEQRRPYDQNRPHGSGYQDRHYGGGYQSDRPQGGYYGDRPQSGGFRRPYDQNRGGYQNRPHGGGYQDRHHGGGYQSDRPQGGYYGDRPQGGGYRRPYDQGGGGYQNRPHGGGYQDRHPGGGYHGDRPQGGGFRRPYGQGGGGGFQRGGFQRGGFQRRPVNKQLLISREQVAQIEVLYKRMLPLPNPDAHEVIGKEINLEPNKVFFGINLVRQKLRLPKLPYPKRKLAVSPDQLDAVKSLYEPLLPLPPIGCHKFIAKQLKIDEWRVHVAIGIIRKQMELPRWNPDREDAPEEFKNQAVTKKEEKEEAKKKA